MFGKSKLEKAINNWLKNGGDLTAMLKSIRITSIKSKKDASAISQALKRISFAGEEKESELRSLFNTIAAFFQIAETKAAFNELSETGLPELRRILDEGLKNPTNRESNLMFLLKILALYQQEIDAYKIVEVAKSGFKANGYMWSVILSIFDKKHPHWKIVLDGLKSPLPDDFICVAYLDFANIHAIDGDLHAHPFDTEEGVKRLKKWLLDKNEELYSYARSATTALPFLNAKHQAELFPLARQHPDDTVKVDSAVALARAGDPAGIQELKKWAVDKNHSITACQHLTELGYENEIPPEAQDVDFKALAEMVSWLSHPAEYGYPPDQIHQYDSRILYWPPTNDYRKVWLFKYTYEPTVEDEEKYTGISMVGSVTFSLTDEDDADLTPEEAYGLHCAWELKINNDPRAPGEVTPKAGLKILKRYNKGL